MIPITYLIGDATRPQDERPKIIAHCCNDVGAWGAGFVVALSRRWTEPETQYRAWSCRTRAGLLPLGDVQFVEVAPDIVVANIIGQHETGWSAGIPPIRYEALHLGFGRVADFATCCGASVHMPRVGCGLAGGEWEKVERLLNCTLGVRDVPVFVYDLPREAVAA